MAIGVSRTAEVAGVDASELAFVEFYRREHPRVLAFLRRRVSDGELAYDLCAETFRIAWEREQAGQTLRPGWAFVTARNLLSNHRRSAERLTVLQRRILATDAIEDRPPDVERVTRV